MGYNRSGDRRKERLRRAKRERERLALKAVPQEESGGESQGLLAKVKGVAQSAAAAVGSAVHSVVDTVRGKS